MGLLTDAFIATEEELAAVQPGKHGGPMDFFPTLQAKRVDAIKLVLLEAIVMEQPLPDTDALAQTISQRIISGDGTTEQWIYQFPDEVVKRLASLTLAEVTHYGELWADEAWRDYRGRPPDDIVGLVEYLYSLCDLAEQAQTEGKHLYMWMAL